MSIPFNPRELLALAIKIEENGFDYYSRMAAQVQNPAVKELFELLAKAEEQHIVDFNKIRDLMPDQPYEIPEEYNSPEIEGYLRSFADGKVFPHLRSADDIAREIKSEEAAIQHAISFEKDAIIFFSEIYDMLPADVPERGSVAQLIHQEKIHIAKLYILLGNTTEGH